MKQHYAQDCKNIVHLKNREDMRLQEELEILWDMGKKAEIQQVVEERDRVPGQAVPAKEDSREWVV